MVFQRHNVDSLLNSEISKPESLDYLAFELDGVQFRCFGILHGITGGLNRDYREFVKQSIRSIDGIKLAEKGMKQLYPGCGIDAELEDWAVLRPIDCIVMGFQLLADPRCLYMITVDALREQWHKQDAFIVNQRKHRADLGESTYFHYLNEQERREVAGFLPSQQAISNDLKSMSHWYSVIIPKARHTRIEHPQWRRLLLLERVMHIPCRSIHMLHYALAYAKKYRHLQVNLLVGETHNTDMQYLATHQNEFVKTLSTKQKKAMDKIIKRGARLAHYSSAMEKSHLFFKKVTYIILLLTGASSAIVLYGLIFKSLSLI